MTLTERKRHAYPERYIRKDARNRIYSGLYGKAGGNGSKSKVNTPATDETRRFPYYWSHQQAVQIFEDNINAAMLTSAQRAELERRLEQLQRFKPHGE